MRSTGTLVARNALAMLASQIVTSVLSFIAVPLMARSLGTTGYGNLWLAISVAGFAVLLLDWGQEAYVPIAVAQEPQRAREFLATGLMMRIGLALLIAVPLEAVLRLLGYPVEMRTLVFLMYIAGVVNALATGTMAVVRGLERMAWNAASRIVIDSLHTGLIVLALWLGAKARGVAVVEIVVAMLAVLICGRVIWRLGLWPTRIDLATARQIFRNGPAFILWGGILALQPGLEAVLLSKLGSPEVVGWFGAATRLVTFILFPIFILGGAIGPTLARLRTQDMSAFGQTIRQALRAATLLGAPVAIGTWIFADRGVAFAYGAGFERSAEIVRLLGAYVLPLFANIILGTAIMAGKGRLAWTFWKGGMVLAGAAVSFFLIPFTQARFGNGGLGAAAVTVGAEYVLLTAGLALLPRGLFSLRELTDVVRAFVAAAAMLFVARLLAPAPFAVALIGSVLAYAISLVALGAIGTKDALLLRETMRSGLGRSG